MPDISKCEGYDCPLKESCYRFASKDTPHRQSYFVEDPRDVVQSTSLDEIKVCSYWMPWCPECKARVYIVTKFSGDLCERCRKILRKSHLRPKGEDETPKSS